MSLELFQPGGKVEPLMTPSPFEPLMLFRSFLTVVSGFFAAQFVYLVIGLALGYLLFPEFLTFFGLDAAEQKRQIAENLSAVMPWRMFAAHAFVSFIALFFVGWLWTAWSPFAVFQHGMFIAILLFVWFLQNFVADPPSKKTMDAILMVTQPLAVLWGAHRSSSALVAAAAIGKQSND
jgi:hypothetical protein